MNWAGKAGVVRAGYASGQDLPELGRPRRSGPGRLSDFPSGLSDASATASGSPPCRSGATERDASYGFPAPSPALPSK